MCGFAYIKTLTWRLEDNFQGLNLFFHHGLTGSNSDHKACTSTFKSAFTY